MKDVEVTTEKLQAAIKRLESEGLGGAIPSDDASPEGQGGESPFAFLQNAEKPVLRRLFNQEHTRDAATVLSTLPKNFASTVLMDLEPSRRVKIIRQLVSISALDEKEIVDLRFSLRLRMQKMLNAPDSGVSDASESKQNAKTSAEESRHYETLHKLSELSNKQIKQLLKRIDTSHLAPALKTLPIQLQRKVLRNMASKPAAIVSREIVDVRIDEKHRIERSSRSVARAIKELNDNNKKK
jgi:flagellar motor switch protein FliG